VIVSLEWLAGEKTYLKRDWEEKVDRIINMIEQGRGDRAKLLEVRTIIEWEADKSGEP